MCQAVLGAEERCRETSPGVRSLDTSNHHPQAVVSGPRGLCPSPSPKRNLSGEVENAQCRVGIRTHLCGAPGACLFPGSLGRGKAASGLGLEGLGGALRHPAWNPRVPGTHPEGSCPTSLPGFTGPEYLSPVGAPARGVIGTHQCGRCPQ